VAADANLEQTLPLLAKGGFYHAGQVCVSVQRVFVHRSISRQLAEGLAALARHAKVGDPADEHTEVGPLIRHGETRRVEAWVDDAIARANALPFAFQAAVFTQDIDTAMYVSKHLAAATVMVNDHTAFRVDWMPFAGLRESGHGVGGIPYTYRDMTVEKLIVVKSPML
jgi:acyl-CoA reductase-like NAD-dependent aldehyde dehydrogenase